MISSNRALHKLAGFKGMKIRVNSSKVIEAQTRAVGAIPQTLAFSEVYQALQTGVVDGAETVMSNVLTQNSTKCKTRHDLAPHAPDLRRGGQQEILG